MGIPNPPIFDDEHPPQPGDALRLNSAGDAWEPFTPSGASGPFRFVESDLINFNTAGLTTGVPIYVPVVGEWLFDIWPVILTGFDGTSPLGDVALQAGFTASGNDSGLFKGISGNPIDCSTADSVASGWTATAAAGLLAPDTLTNASLASAYASAVLANSVPARPFGFVTTDPLLAVISQTGHQGGVAVGGAAGSMKFLMVIGTPA